MFMKSIDLQPGYTVKFFETKKKGGTLSIRGELYDVASGKVVKALSKVVENADQIPYKEKQIFSIFIDLLKPKISAPRVMHSGSQLIEALVALQSTGDIIRPEWSSATQKVAYADFNRFSSEIQKAIESNDINDLQKGIEEKVKEHGNSKNAVSVEKTVHSIMFRLAVVYNELRARYPALLLPDINIAPAGRATRRQEELPKMLPDEVRQAFLRAIEGLAATDPAVAKTAVVMTLGGRTAEACAADEKDIEVCKNGCVVALCAQMKEHMKTSTMKTRSSYRAVPGTMWHGIILQKCIESSEALGVTLLADPKEAAKIIKKMLIDCGVKSQMVREAEHDLSLVSDDSIDLSAYVLRRDFASLAKNIMGLSSYEIDMLLGHKNYSRKVAHPDLRNPAELDRIRAAMERYVYSAEISNNPSASPINLKAGADVSVIPYQTIAAVNSDAEPIHVVIDVVAVEPAAMIALTSSHSLANMTARSIKAPSIRTNRIVI